MNEEECGKYGFLKKIDDQVIRSLCQMGFAERDRLKNELNLLKSKTVLKIDMRPLGSRKGNLSTGSKDSVGGRELTDSEMKALSAAIDPAALALKRMRVGEAGEILDDRGRFVFNPGFATAVAKLLGKA